MKKLTGVITVVLLCAFAIGYTSFAASGKDNTIKSGIYAGDINLSGMTKDAAMQQLQEYVTMLSNSTISLVGVSGNSVNVSASELGITWANPEIVDEAFSIGRSGNIISRFKECKDLESSKKVFDIEITADDELLRNVISANCVDGNCEAVDAKLERKDGKFVVTPGRDGIVVDVNESVNLVRNFIENEWHGGDVSVDLAVVTSKPKCTTEDLEQVKDVLGTYTTSFKTSAKGRSANVRNGCAHINGTMLRPGEQLSVYSLVSPFTEENGYYLAGSYNSGLVVETLGGGICQVSSTLYNAVIRAELQVDQRQNHSMVVTYVDLSADAAISGTEKDFKFTNNTDYPIYIAGSTTEDKQITFTIYGKETRPENRSLSFETEKISETEPEGEKIIADPSQPVGYKSTQSAHTGYKANYWKIVKVDGVETEREKLNTSYYMAVPKTITFGTAGDVTGQMGEAIATQSGDVCSAISDQLVNAANLANIQAAQAAQEAAAAEAMD